MTQPKVLLVGPHDGATIDWIAAALADHGCVGGTIDHRQLQTENDNAKMNLAIVNQSLGYDLVLALKGDGIRPRTWKMIREAGSSTAIWMFDAWCANSKDLLDSAAAVDSYFTVSHGLVPWYRKQGIPAYWLPEACDPDAHRPMPPPQNSPAFQSTFIGTIKGIQPREDFLVELRQLLGGGIHFFGSHPGRLAGPTHHGRTDEFTGLNDNEALAHVVGRSLVNVDHQRNPELSRTYGARMWRTLAMNGCLITNKINGLRQDFNGCVATYDDAADAARLVSELAADPARRQRMGLEGRRLVVERHTFRHRVAELLDQVGLPHQRVDENGLIHRGGD